MRVSERKKPVLSLGATGSLLTCRLGLAALTAFLLQVVTWAVGIGGSDAHLVFMVAGVLCLVPVFLLWRRDAADLQNCVQQACGLAARIPMTTALTALVAPFALLWLLKYIAMYFALDLSNMDAGAHSNVAYNTATGHPFYSSVLGRSHLGEHFSPIMAVFAPLYAVLPGVHWLLAAQWLSYVVVPYLIYAIAIEVIPDRAARNGVTLLLGLMWFLYRPMTAAMDFPFHPSTLAAPWILLAFYFMVKQSWGRMYVVLVFLLAFKESLGLVWIGFGLYMCCALRRYKRGIILAAVGAVATLLIMKGVLPRFRSDSWGHLARIGPLTDVGPKSVYLLRVFLPLMFLPLVYWRNGVLALPVVCLNLATNYPPQYSVAYHYDDMAAPLLIACLVPVLAKVWRAGISLLDLRWRVLLLVIVYVVAMCCVGRSPGRYFRKNLPVRKGRQLIGELHRLNLESRSTLLYLQSHLGVHVNRYEQAQFPRDCADYAALDYEVGSIIVLSTNVNSWGIPDMNACLSALEGSPARFERLDGYEHIVAYRVLK